MPTQVARRVGTIGKTAVVDLDFANDRYFAKNTYGEQPSGAAPSWVLTTVDFNHTKRVTGGITAQLLKRVAVDGGSGIGQNLNVWGLTWGDVFGFIWGGVPTPSVGIHPTVEATKRVNLPDETVTLDLDFANDRYYARNLYGARTNGDAPDWVLTTVPVTITKRVSIADETAVLDLDFANDRYFLRTVFTEESSGGTPTWVMRPADLNTKRVSSVPDPTVT